MKKIVAIILAAGSGTRCNTEIPKQYVSVAGRPVVMWSIEAFRSAVKDVETVMVINPETETLWLDLCRKHDFQSPRLVCGGATRWESVKNAIMSIPYCQETTVLIHDGARPAVDACNCQCKALHPLTQSFASVPANVCEKGAFM